LHQPCSPSAWFFINYMSRGYGHSTMQSADGNYHLNLLVAGKKSPFRDYWQTMLLTPLQVGNRYNVSLKVASPSGYINLRNIGLYFSGAFIYTTQDTVLQPSNYLSFQNAKVKKLKNGWYELKHEFIASNSFQYMIIGNFSDKTNQQIAVEEKLSSNWSYIAVDEISITANGKLDLASAQKRKDSLYAIASRHNTPYRSLPAYPSVIKARTDTLIVDDIVFDYNSFEIKNKDSLNYLRSYLLDSTIKRIRIIGYTDSIGSAPYNKSLSQSRAEAVNRYIKEDLQIQLQAQVEGKGASVKFSDPHQNRRVEIWIYR
jgi:outer membrane protein OmpA-like peptidoglycan-associated protein